MLLPKHVLDRLDFYKLKIGERHLDKLYNVYITDTVVLVFKAERRHWWQFKSTQSREAVTMRRITENGDDGSSWYVMLEDFAELREQLRQWAGGRSGGGGPDGKEPIPEPEEFEETKATGTDGKIIQHDFQKGK